MTFRQMLWTLLVGLAGIAVALHALRIAVGTP